MFVAEGLKRNPDSQRWVMGWAVVRRSPWHLIGLYASKDMADTKAGTLGEEYESAYGSHCLGTDDFIFEDSPKLAIHEVSQPRKRGAFLCASHAQPNDIFQS